MTKGSWTLDNRSYFTSNCGGTNASWKGTYSKKTWSGGDRSVGSTSTVPHSYGMTAIRQLQSPLKWRQRYDAHLPPNSGAINSCGFGPLSPVVTWDSSDDYKLLDKLQGKVSGGEFNFSVFLGEGHQTLGLLGDTALKLGKALRQVSKGNITGAAKTLTGKPPKGHVKPFNQASSSWLELQYGWLPLLGDAHGAAEKLAHHMSEPFKKSYRVRRQKSAEVLQPSHGLWRWSQNVRVLQKQVIFTVSEDWGGLSIPQLLGLQDPELVAWELVPFSFVCDWFIPIGNYLQARAFSQKLKGTFVTTTSNRWLFKGLVDGVSSSSSSYVFFNTGLAERKDEIAQTRSVTTQWDVPKPTIKPLSKAASWQHTANAVALLVGMKTNLRA